MSAIRPDLPAPLPPTGGTAPAVRAAQADFFRAAMAQAFPAQVQTLATSAPPAPLRATAAPDLDRTARPGSLLDIRV